MRRGSIVQLVLLGALIGGGVTLVALLIPWLPPAASEERNRIDLVFWVTTAICIGIFAVVGALVLMAVVRFRARPDDDSDGPPIHGHTGIEIVWTAIPTVLVTAIAVLASVVLIQNSRAGRSPMEVRVISQQFAWSFEYLNGEAKGVTSTVLRLPLDRTVKLRIESKDVIHSFWVPEFGQKQDAVPGQTKSLVITPNKLGEFPVICTELCGFGHALMRSRAIVERPAAFSAWAREQRRKLGGGAQAAGQTVFANNGCGSCHTLAAAGTSGKVGPDLDKLPELARRAGQPLEQFVRESIVNPNAYVEPGYPKGVMPPFAQLPGEQLDALVQYLIASTKGESQ